MWVAYAVISALAAYANFWAALVPLAHGASIAFLPPGTAPVAPPGPHGGRSRCPPRPPGPAHPRHRQLRGQLGRRVERREAVHHGAFRRAPSGDRPSLVVLVVALVVASVAVLRRHRGLTQAAADHWPVVFALCWLVVPVAAVVLLSLVYKPLLVVRYLVICLPPFVMLVSYGLARLRGRQGGGRRRGRARGGRLGRRDRRPVRPWLAPGLAGGGGIGDGPRPTRRRCRDLRPLHPDPLPVVRGEGRGTGPPATPLPGRAPGPPTPCATTRPSPSASRPSRPP